MCETNACSEGVAAPEAMTLSCQEKHELTGEEVGMGVAMSFSTATGPGARGQHRLLSAGPLRGQWHEVQGMPPAVGKPPVLKTRDPGPGLGLSLGREREARSPPWAHHRVRETLPMKGPQLAISAAPLNSRPGALPVAELAQTKGARMSQAAQEQRGKPAPSALKSHLSHCFWRMCSTAGGHQPHPAKNVSRTQLHSKQLPQINLQIIKSK